MLKLHNTGALLFYILHYLLNLLLLNLKSYCIMIAKLPCTGTNNKKALLKGF